MKTIATITIDSEVKTLAMSSLRAEGKSLSGFIEEQLKKYNNRQSKLTTQPNTQSGQPEEEQLNQTGG
jgi:predicted CopG family antitoxin